jgi:tetratricopeptide (TPR) repeat protein
METLTRGELIAEPSNNCIFVTDLAARMLRAATTQLDCRLFAGLIVHELIHLSEPFFRVSSSKEWLAVAKPAIDFVDSRFFILTEKHVRDYILTAKQSRDNSVLLYRLAAEAGLPTPYAALDPREALAECVRAMILDPAYRPPAKIEAFLKGRFLTGAYEPDKASRLMHGGVVALATRNVDKAIELFDEAIRIDPQWLYAHVYLAQAHMAKKDTRRALAGLATALEAFPDKPELLAIRAAVWQEANEPDKAIDDIQKCLQLDSYNPMFLVLRGQCQHQKMQPDQAARDFTQAIQLAPEWPLPYFYRANTNSQLKHDYNAAIVDLTRAIHLNPKYTQAYVARGINYQLGKKELEKAVQDYSSALRLDPKHLVALQNLAWLLATSSRDELRNGKQAVEYATTACELTAWKDWKHLDTLAAALAEAGEFSEAVRRAKAALEAGKLTHEDSQSIEKRIKLYEMRKAYRE